MRLPRVKKIRVEHLSLYKEAIDQIFYPGINMIIGGNGIGKTTLINSILYGLVGNATYKRFNLNTGKYDSIALINENYFQGRIEPKDQDRAKIELTFEINNLQIKVERTLNRPKILRFVVYQDHENGQLFEDKNYSDLENEYRKLMAQNMEIEHFEHFVFLVANLLLFDEKRLTLVWDNEIQNRVIRLLFFGRKQDEEFDDLSSKVTIYDTESRHKSEERKDIRNAIKDWLARKAEMTEQNVSESTSELMKTEQEIAHLEEALENIESEIENTEKSLESEVSQRKELIANIDKIELEKLPLIEKVKEVENQFYSDIYQNVPPEYVLILESLIKKGVCQICGNTGSNLKKLGKELKDNGICLVCRNPIKYEDEKIDDKHKEALIETINLLREKIEKLESDQKANIDAQISTDTEIKKLQDLLVEKKYQKRQIQSKTLELKALYSSKANSESIDESQKDIWLVEQQKRIAKLDTEINNLRKKSKDAQKALQKISKELINILNNVNEELTPLFSHFASKFLSTECELVISQKTKARKPVAYMYPRFNNKERKETIHVSESQRFFLDQAFRMALITWFIKQNQEATFYIIETPEGSLDLAYERNVAEMYSEFASYGHSIIVTSNLNSSDFLKSLYDSFEDNRDKEKRTLDLFKYGRLSNVQELSIGYFNERLKQLKLPLFQLPEDK